MAEVFGNLATSTLNGSITDSALTLTLTSGSAFPSSGTFRINIDDEIITVTSRSSDILTLTARGAESTTAAAHASGADVSLVLTAAGLSAGISDSATAHTAASDPHSQYVLEATASVTGTLALAGDISPTALTGDVNDYSPTGLSGATTIRLDASTAGPWNVNGLAGGADGRIVILHNTSGTYTIIVTDANTNATATNRFLNGGFDIRLGPNQSVAYRYDSTTGRWRLFGQPSHNDAAFAIISATDDLRFPNSTTLPTTPQGTNISGTWDDIIVDVDAVDTAHADADDAVHVGLVWGTPVDVGTANDAGVSTERARSDHVHAATSTTTGLASITAAVTQANLATDVDVLSYAASADFLTAGKVLRLDYTGVFTNNVGAGPARSVQPKLKIGSTTIVAGTQSIVTGNVDAPFTGYFLLTCRTAGASGTVIGGWSQVGSDGGTSNWSPVAKAVNNTSTTTVDTTGALTIKLTCANSSADALISFTIHQASLTVVK